jgi:hypothetical protein
MNGQKDQPLGTALWWLGLAIAISLGTVFTIPFPYGLVAIVGILLTVGYIIPMRMIDSNTSRAHAMTQPQILVLQK